MRLLPPARPQPAALFSIADAFINWDLQLAGMIANFPVTGNQGKLRSQHFAVPFEQQKIQPSIEDTGLQRPN